MGRFFRSLLGQVVLALVAGIVIGLVWPSFAASLKPLGDAFIKLIKMIIPVLVFCVVVHGIAGAGDLKRVGRVGVKALIYPRWRWRSACCSPSWCSRASA